MTRALSEKTVALASRFEAIGGLLRHYLTSMDFPILWEALSGEESLRMCQKKAPKILIISPVYPDFSAPELTKAARALNPDIKILLFTGILHKDFVRQMIQAEVHGIVAASSPLPSLLTALDVLQHGGCYFDGVTESYLHASKETGAALSARERSVLRLIAEGLSSKEVASTLEISVKTAEKFRERIMKKLDLHDAVRLTRYAIRNGISVLE